MGFVFGSQENTTNQMDLRATTPMLSGYTVNKITFNERRKHEFMAR